MEKTIDALRKIVSTSVSREDAAWKITEQFPQVSPIEADKVRKDVSDFITGKIKKSQLSLYLVEAGLA